MVMTDEIDSARLLRLDESSEAKFALGRIVATRGALRELSHEEILSALSRHVAGDWGDLDHEDWAANESALRADDGFGPGGRYPDPGRRADDEAAEARAMAGPMARPIIPRPIAIPRPPAAPWDMSPWLAYR